MNRTIYAFAGAAMACAAVFATPAAAQELVTNGGFETGFTGWTQSGDTSFDLVVDITAGVPIPEGSYVAAFGAVEGTSNITQTLGTLSGATYSWSFSLANLFGAPGNEVTVTLGGVTLLTLTDAAFFNPTPYSGSFVASGPSSDLSFTFRNDQSYWLLDSVSVQFVSAAPVPEPTTWAMMIGGFGLVGAGMRRRVRGTVRFA